MIAAADYQNPITNNKVEGKTPSFRWERGVFWWLQKLIGNGDRIGNLLEHFHHQNINFLVLGSGMSNLLEMLLDITTSDSYVDINSIS